jgi:hypothetical protein
MSEGMTEQEFAAHVRRRHDVVIVLSMPETREYRPEINHQSLMLAVGPGPWRELQRIMGNRTWTLVYDWQNGFPLDLNRNNSVKTALSYQADYWITLDSDMVFPWDVIPRLIETMENGGVQYRGEKIEDVPAQDIDILSGLYFWKKPPYMPVSGILIRTDFPFHICINTQWPGLVKTDIVGAGCLCCRGAVLKQMVYPYFFYREWKDGVFSSEDILFSVQAREAGFKAWTDTRIKCGHLLQQVVSHESWTPHIKEAFDEHGGLRPEAISQDTKQHLSPDLDLSHWPGSWPGIGKPEDTHE